MDLLIKNMELPSKPIVFHMNEHGGMWSTGTACNALFAKAEPVKLGLVPLDEVCDVLDRYAQMYRDMDDDATASLCGATLVAEMINLKTSYSSKIREVRDSKPGDMISLFNQRRRFKVLFVNKKWAVLSKTYFGNYLVVTFDFENEMLSSDIMYGADTEEIVRCVEKDLIDIYPNDNGTMNFATYNMRYMKEK